MSCNNQNSGGLRTMDKELVALGAAVASNCIPCVEYHIAQARKAGLSDTAIGEAVTLADKIRRVPADKVLQTAFARLEQRGRPSTAPNREVDQAAAGQTGASHRCEDRLDNDRPREHNEDKEHCCGDRPDRANDAPHGDEASAGPRNAEDRTRPDFGSLMEMIRKCCPDRAEDFSSMMSEFSNRCGSAK